MNAEVGDPSSPTTTGVTGQTTGTPETTDPTATSGVTGTSATATTTGESSSTGADVSTGEPVSSSSTTMPDTDGPTCAPKLCVGKMYACGDCMDNDGDGKIDAEDVECINPCDDDEGSFATGIPGDADCSIEKFDQCSPYTKTEDRSPEECMPELCKPCINQPLPPDCEEPMCAMGEVPCQSNADCPGENEYCSIGGCCTPIPQ